MDTLEFSSGRSPRRELQGPRPAPLKVRKDSHKIRKPPVAPPPQQLQPRPPVIIYTVSPKIIHANPNEFMSLVQRLTGPNSTSTSTSVFQENFNNGGISPAARFASIEKTKSPEGRKLPQAFNGMEMVGGINISTEIDNTCRQFQGILSPNPASLPTIPSKHFSLSSDTNPLNFFYDLSPVLHSNKNYLERSLIPSPTFLSPYMPSPNTVDLFHSLFDL
ncbi:protein MKS1-like isoform X1 [Olea europaea var. sylvestris]|uniref:protein MKS1-like isoform X1 n=1 Tax=Olea europaea var. sylvestris TaxID=158386 RepID=UPI000C1D2322|nr:protein MKS1-like isoform X1 [Olea europaea var. sylvestris]